MHSPVNPCYSEPVSEIHDTVQKLVAYPKGILAADESMKTIEKRFTALSVENTQENRRAYRELLFTTPEIQNYISGVILFDETIKDTSSDGKPMIELLTSRGIAPGIKVDEGTEPLSEMSEEKVTKGLDGLPERLKAYYEMGARFTKWRAVITIGAGIPTDACIDENVKRLSQYAKDSQAAGLVPIVEPETVMDGDHDMAACRQATYRTLKKLFIQLSADGVDLTGLILKINMILPGKDSGMHASDGEIAETTVSVLTQTVPEETGGVVFLSGGQTPEEASTRLAMITKHETPWPMTFSFSRALQDPVMKAWAAHREDRAGAQSIFLDVAKRNSAALRDPNHE